MDKFSSLFGLKVQNTKSEEGLERIADPTLSRAEKAKHIQELFIAGDKSVREMLCLDPAQPLGAKHQISLLRFERHQALFYDLESASVATQSSKSVIGGIFLKDNRLHPAIVYTFNLAQGTENLVREFELLKWIMKLDEGRKNFFPTIYAIEEKRESKGCGDRAIVVMERCKRFSELPHLEATQKTCLFLDMLQSVHTLHHVGQYLHRDIKMDNFVFRDMGRGKFQAVMIDFGSVMAWRHSIRRGVQAGYTGTRDHSAPELLSAKRQDHRYNEQTEVFALGGVGYELMTGNRRPLENLQLYRAFSLESEYPKQFHFIGEYLQAYQILVERGAKSLYMATDGTEFEKVVAESLSIDPESRPELSVMITRLQNSLMEN